MKKKKRSKSSDRAAAVVQSFAAQNQTRTAGDWDSALGRLRRALGSKTKDAAVPDAEHAGIEEMLPLYVADANAGIDVRRTYPLIWKHLEHCTECSALYEILAENADSPVNRVSALEQELAAPALSDFSTAWSRSLQENVIVFRFHIPSELHQERSRSGARFATRGLEQADEVLLFSDTIACQKKVVSFQAWLEVQDTKKKQCCIRVRIFPYANARFKATLYWNGHSKRAKNDKHDLLFSNIELSATNTGSLKKTSPEYRLELSAG